ncbi:hypothetical protein ABZZ17_34245 [Streptomyces sp. NPDC006512]|uniref:hypothetical protein n=1 Tax=Streptomyces sp. NPDC006512 TaxID=3154307 RepID=UPI0033A83DB7
MGPMEQQEYPLVRRLHAADPRLREDAAREVAATLWGPEAERVLAAALVTAVREERDPAALAAQLEALPSVETGLDDADLTRLAQLTEPPPVLARVLARAGRLQVSGPVEPVGAATRAVVRCLRGVPRTGLSLRTPLGAWVVLERIELYGRAADRLDPGASARVLLSGPGARALGEWDRLEADPRAREYVRLLRAPDPRVRELAAAGTADWPDSWDPETGTLLCAALARAAAREPDLTALETELGALLQLARFLSPPARAALRALDRTTLPPALHPCLDALLATGPAH